MGWSKTQVKQFKENGTYPVFLPYCPPLYSDSSSVLYCRLKSKDVISAAAESVIWDPPLELGLAKEDDDASNQKINGEQKEELLEFQPLLKLPAKLNDLKVRVSHVNSPSSFYVQLTQYNTQLKRSAVRTSWKLIKSFLFFRPIARVHCIM